MAESIIDAGISLPRRMPAMTAAFFAVCFLLFCGAAAFGEEQQSRKAGKKLYQDNCSRCHGDLEESAKSGRSMNRIRTAVRIQPQHKEFDSLPDEQLLLIALVLKDSKD